VGKPSKRAFSKEHIAALTEKLHTVGPKTDRLMMKCAAHPFAEAKAGEYARHGFARRIQTLCRCIENVFKIVPPNTARVPSKQRLHDAQINIQAAIANIYGCIDNLAWVWVYERGLSKHVKPQQVGLRKHNVQVRASLSEDFQAHLDTLERWLEYLADYRHAVAHRIPLYIPPGGVRSKDFNVGQTPPEGCLSPGMEAQRRRHRDREPTRAKIRFDRCFLSRSRSLPDAKRGLRALHGIRIGLSACNAILITAPAAVVAAGGLP
jgi:hypothetical protein